MLVTEEPLTKDMQDFNLTTTQLEILAFPTLSVSIQASQVALVLIHDWIQQLAQPGASFFISSLPHFICIAGCLLAPPPSVWSLQCIKITLRIKS